MKKMLCVLLCLVFAVCVLAGCNNNQSQTPEGGDDGRTMGSEGVHYDADGNLVVPKHEGVTLTIGVPDSPNVTDWYDNYYTKWLQEKTGITLEFQKFAYGAADYKKQLATDTAADSTKLPDILWNMSLGDDLVTQYGDDGYFLDISDWVENETKSAILHQRMNDIATDTATNIPGQSVVDRIWLTMYADGSELAVGDDYPIYGLPRVTTSLVDNFDFIPYINTNWLKVVNMDAPKNLEELEQVLIAFRDTDCNGNNKKDEIPMIGPTVDTSCGDTLAWLINFFVYCQNETMFNIDDNGNLYLPQTTDAYRGALEFIKRWIDEGLLHAKTLTYKFSDIKSLLGMGDMVGVVVGQPTSTFASTNKSMFRFEVLDLFGYTYYNLDNVYLRQYITEDCVDLDAAWDLLMLMYTWDSAVIQRFGEEGVDWERSDGTVMSEMGLPATIKVINDFFGTPQKTHWASLNSINTYDTFDLIDSVGSNEWVASKWKKLGDVSRYYAAAHEKTVQELGAKNICPYLQLNTEEKEISDGRANVKDAIKNWTLNFLNGSKVLDDATWAEYLQELNTAGMQEWIDAAQMCYERMYPNGHVG